MSIIKGPSATIIMDKVKIYVQNSGVLFHQEASRVAELEKLRVAIDRRSTELTLISDWFNIELLLS